MTKEKKEIKLEGVTIDGVQWFPALAKPMGVEAFVKAHKEAYRVKMSVGKKKGETVKDADIEKKLKEIFSKF